MFRHPKGRHRPVLVNQARAVLTFGFDREHIMNYVPPMFTKREGIMIRAVVEEAAALASITLFVGMIVVWAQVLSVL
jgi:hypothetical protein